MNVGRLRSFVAVAEELHFGRAAERLHLAQPPLSRQIRQLEAELGVSLFERTTRRVTLTDAGQLLYPYALRALAAHDDAASAIDAFRRGETGTLRLGFVDSSSYDVMPRFLQRYRTELPDVDYELRSLSSDQQHDALLGREIDLGIARVTPTGAGITATPFMEERLLLAVPSEHKLANRARVGIARLVGESFVGFERTVSPSLFRDLSSLLGEANIVYDPIIEATEYTTVLGLVASGQGLAVVPASVRSFNPPGLRYIDLADDTARSSLMLLHRDNEPSLLVQRAIDVVSHVFALGV